MAPTARIGYSSIPSLPDDEDLHPQRTEANHQAEGGAACTVPPPRRRWPRRATTMVVASIAAAAALPAAFVAGGRWPPLSDDVEGGIRFVPLFAKTREHAHTHTHDTPGLPMPHGVNLASWLSLEDYFYVGDRGAVEVATPDGITAARCLPPLHVGPSTGPDWNSETDLFANLSDSDKGGSVASAVRIFHAFRVAYMDWDEELGQIASMGIRRVRVPLSWCLTDYDPSHDDILTADDDGIGVDEATTATLEERYTCMDPFFAREEGFEKVSWPAVPRSFLARFLRACARHGIRATLDVHTYPGGTSLGTFSGVWPRKPLFWKYDDPEHPNDDLGRRLYGDFLGYIEALAELDPEAFAGLGAISPMNEPAHLAGLFGPGSANPDAESFLPSLPDDLAREYLSELSGEGGTTRGDPDPSSPSSHVVSVPDGPHLRVLLWLRDAVSHFRSTTLPNLGIEIHVNIHESILVQSIVPDDRDDPGGRHPHATSILASWWVGTTTGEERGAWAVLDMHHYHAWEPRCQGTVDPAVEGYTCGDEVGTDEVLGVCTSWAGMYRSAVNGNAGLVGAGDDDDDDSDAATPRARLASAEFSASTHHTVHRSCVDVTTLRKSYLAQIEAADDAGVDLYWWSWKMPHGGAFRRAWSFKHLMYLLGLEGFDRPDESEIKCGD